MQFVIHRMCQIYWVQSEYLIGKEILKLCHKPAQAPTSLTGPSSVLPMRGQVRCHQHCLHLLHTTAINCGVWSCHNHHLLHVDTHIWGRHGTTEQDAQQCYSSRIPSPRGSKTGNRLQGGFHVCLTEYPEAGV